MTVLPASRRSDQFAANAHDPPFLLAKLLDRPPIRGADLGLQYHDGGKLTKAAYT